MNRSTVQANGVTKSGLPKAPWSSAAGEQEAALRVVDGHPDWPGEAHTAVTSSFPSLPHSYPRRPRQSVNIALWQEYQTVSLPRSKGHAT
jgi:hypothetical protein